MGLTERLSVLIDVAGGPAIAGFHKVGAEGKATFDKLVAEGNKATKAVERAQAQLAKAQGRGNEAAIAKATGRLREAESAVGVLAAKGSIGAKALNSIGVESAFAGQALKAGVVVGAGAAGLAIGKFTLSGVKNLAELAAQIRAFQRVSGASAGDASKLVAVTGRYGIDAEQAAKGVFTLSKVIAEQPEKLEALGISIARDKAGHEDLLGTLFNVADAYKASGNQVAKNEIAVTAFSKRIAIGLLPLLSKTREELAAVAAEAAKRKQILTQDELDKLRDYSLALKDLHQSTSGLGRALGEGLVGPLTAASHGLTTGIDDINGMAGAIDTLLATGLGIASLAVGVKVVRSLGGAFRDTAGDASTLGVAAGALAKIGVSIAVLQGLEAAADKAGDAIRGTEARIKSLQSKTGKALADTFEEEAQHRARTKFFSTPGGQRRELFRETAEENPAAGQRLIDVLRAKGQATGEYERILAKAKATAVQAAKDQQSNTQSIQDGIGPTDDLAESTGSLATGMDKVDDAGKAMNARLESAKSITSALSSRMDELLGNTVDLDRANADLQSSFDDLRKSLKDDPQEIADASDALTEAKVKQARAAEDIQRLTDQSGIAARSGPEAARKNAREIEDARLAKAAADKDVRDRQAALDKTKNKGVDTFDPNTEQGRDQLGKLDSAVSGIQNDVRKAIERGASPEEVRGIFERDIAELRKVFADSGFPAAEIENLVKQYNLTPATVQIAVDLAGAEEVEKQLANIAAAISHIGDIANAIVAPLGVTVPQSLIDAAIKQATADALHGRPPSPPGPAVPPPAPPRRPGPTPPPQVFGIPFPKGTGRPPSFARGGIVGPHPGLAEVGHGMEVILPLGDRDRSTQLLRQVNLAPAMQGTGIDYDRLAGAIVAAMGHIGQSKVTNYNLGDVKVDDPRRFVEYMDQQRRRTAIASSGR